MSDRGRFEVARDILMGRPTVNKVKAKKGWERITRNVLAKYVETIVHREKKVKEKVTAMGPARFKKLINQSTLLFEMLKDFRSGEYTDISWYTLVLAVGAVNYLLSPIDVILDAIPVIGYMDDVVVVGLAVLAIRRDLKKYCTFKGYKAEEYF